ncbi:MAG: tRNA uridine-5-carboxymethylaminomethyl(34) synthesis GTPase MnmE [Chthoniobacteraceae bacterium]|nr:tRNA uridine-5-carboxymethylaminomethyl(34) synthesis GTPase MnmE [Chthoniobacteraceae bacterium]
MQETIAAVCTAFGEGAIAVLRLSGPRAVAIADGIFRSKRRVAELPARFQQLGSIVTGGLVLDEVLLTVFRAPASYTGEEMVEIACHGGILVTRRLLALLLERGARAAGPGEFTQRAFLNGKMDLTQAEAVMDLIRAQTDLGLRAAAEQLEGRLGGRIRELRETLVEILAHVEAYIDFPEEEITPDTGAALQARLDGVGETLAGLLRTADQGRVLREGVRTVLYGAPNVGKSSLLNRLLGFERAIVSETPGTTRDTIEEVINVRGLPLRLIDTAGVRAAHDAVEREGIARTLRHLERADLVLHIVDASQPRPGEALDPARLLVLNKIDLGEHPSWAGAAGVRVSCLESAGPRGIDPLAEAIAGRVLGGGFAGGDVSIAINARHQACLQNAARFAQAARAALADGLSAEFVALELHSALDAVGDMVGRVDTEDLLGKIFSTFCVGK